MYGEWLFWRENGDLWQVGNFREGKKHGEWLRYAQDGRVDYREVFEDGKPRIRRTG